MMVRPEEEDGFKAAVVAAILDSRTEDALDMLCEHYKVVRPRLGVGVFEGHTKGVQAVYSPKRMEILAAKRDFLYDPFTILHEFYHHLRSFGNKHRGTEKHADRFAIEYIDAYNRVLAKLAEEQASWSSRTRTDA